MGNSDADKIVSALKELNRSVEKLGKAIETPKTTTVNKFNQYVNGGNQPGILTEIPVAFDMLTPAVKGEASVQLTPDDRLELKVVVSGEDAAILQGLINEGYFQSLHISSVVPT